MVSTLVSVVSSGDVIGGYVICCVSVPVVAYDVPDSVDVVVSGCFVVCCDSDNVISGVVTAAEYNGDDGTVDSTLNLVDGVVASAEVTDNSPVTVDLSVVLVPCWVSTLEVEDSNVALFHLMLSAMLNLIPFGAELMLFRLIVV